MRKKKGDMNYATVTLVVGSSRERTNDCLLLENFGTRCILQEEKSSKKKKKKNNYLFNAF